MIKTIKKFLTYVASVDFVVLLMAELIYFRIADKCISLISRTKRSSHSKVVLQGGRSHLWFGYRVWSCLYGFQYPWMLAAVTLAAGIPFEDDILQFAGQLAPCGTICGDGIDVHQLDILHLDMWWIVLLALIVCVWER